MYDIVEKAFADLIGGHASAQEANDAVVSGEAGFGVNVVGATTSDQINGAGFTIGGTSGIYSTRVVDNRLVLHVLLSGVGATQDWVGQHVEVTYTCVTMEGIPPNTKIVAVTEAECPSTFPAIVFPGRETAAVSLNDLRNE